MSLSASNDSIAMNNQTGPTTTSNMKQSAVKNQRHNLRSRKLQAQLESCLVSPNRLMFLDIETTGLSHYYDDITVIGWAIGGHGGAVVGGADTERFYKAVSTAVGLVTFNGLRFDRKFLTRDYPDLNFPPLHIDLMYLCRRLGLTGGQKAIENQLNINVRMDAEGVTGQHAVLLWHQFIRGDLDALFQLISYNRADIAAMGHIFDECIRRINLPSTLFEEMLCFSKWSSPKVWETTPHQLLEDGDRSRWFTFDSVFRRKAASRTTVVGIDLTGSEKRKSGWCLLEGKVCKVRSLRYTQELIDETLRASPDLVSIDSPLCLPSGRNSVWDDDPARESCGIIRECERELKRRGINVYPSLIGSMQKLTNRGMNLADEFRERGIAVVESYPGAAQDIMKIPRKGAGEKFLKQGLREFGIEDGNTIEAANHDELDAITAALVGLFHWFGMSEPLGTENEEPLIVPCTKPRDVPCVIGVSGPIAAGKSTMSRALEKAGFQYSRFSLAIDDILREEGIYPTRMTRQALGQELNSGGRQRYLCYRTVARVGNANAIVIDGLRFMQDHAWMVENFGAKFTHVHVKAAANIRRTRFERVEGTGKFRAAGEALVERQVDALQMVAHHVFSNDRELSDLVNFVSRLLTTVDRRE